MAADDGLRHWKKQPKRREKRRFLVPSPTETKAKRWKFKKKVLLKHGTSILLLFLKNSWMVSWQLMMQKSQAALEKKNSKRCQMNAAMRVACGKWIDLDNKTIVSQRNARLAVRKKKKIVLSVSFLLYGPRKSVKRQKPLLAVLSKAQRWCRRGKRIKALLQPIILA